MNKFYAVSTGPAGSDYLTLGAVKVLEKCKTIFYPITGENKHIAFDCVCEAVDVSQKNCVGVKFSMTSDKARTQKEYDDLAQKVREALSKNDVAFVAIGDVSIYSTAARVARQIERDGFETKFIAGVTSFCACACECTLDLAERDEGIWIVPGDAFFSQGKIDRILGESGTKIFMKSPRHLKEIIGIVKSKGLVASAHLIQGVGYESQQIFSGSELNDLADETFEKSYMSVLIVE